MAEQGKFISFEGIDNCGKTTQLELTAAYLKSKNIPIEVGKEPGTTALGSALRTIIKKQNEVYQLFNIVYQYDPDFTQISIDEKRTPEAELYLFMASRVEYIVNEVEPALKKGKSYLTDRTADSSDAYQGGGCFHSVPEKINLIKLLNNDALRGIWPDKTFLIDISYDCMISRSSGKKLDYMESKGRAFFERTINQYRINAAQNPERIVIDGSQSINDIFEQGILPHINQLFNIKY